MGSRLIDAIVGGREGDELRFITQSAVGRDFAYVIGEQWLIKARDRDQVPDALLHNSEQVPMEQITPYHRTFDPVAYQNATKPRPEPQPTRYLTREEILAEKFPHWTLETLQRAIADAKFPKRHHTIDSISEDPNSMWGEGMLSVPVWSEDEIDKWIESVKHLGI